MLPAELTGRLGGVNRPIVHNGRDDCKSHLETLKSFIIAQYSWKRFTLDKKIVYMTLVELNINTNDYF
jgi:hypothetical protein